MFKCFLSTALLVLGIAPNDLYAQDFLEKLGKTVSKEISKKGSDLRVQLDSIDFQFAISVNQGAGFFDIEQKGETGSKLLYGFKEEEDKTILEKARDTLEIGIGMYGIRRYEMAESIIRRTKLLMERNNLAREIVYLRVLSNLGLICLTQGKTSEAETYIIQSLTESEETLGKNSAAYIANLNNYAKLHQVLGQYNEAEKEFDEALKYSDEVFGGGMQQAIILNNKAMLYQALGQYDKAVDWMNQAINASSKAPKKAFQGKKSFDNRKFKANLATVYQLSGRYAEAELLFLELKKIFENRRQTKNAEYAGLLNQLAILYIQIGKNHQAEELLTKSAGVYKKRWGEKNIYFAKVINDLGNFHRLNGNYEEAEKWLDKAYSIRRLLLDPSHPNFTKTQEDLAILYWKTGRVDKAYTFYKYVMDKTIDIINRYFPPMSESEKTKFWDITSPRFQRFYNFALENHSHIPNVIQDVYSYHMATKGLLLSATSKVKESILKSNDQQLIDDYLAWRDQKEQLGRLYSYSKSKLKKQNINLAEMEERANAMEKSLSERSSKFSSAFLKDEINYKTISDLLTETEVVVDLLRVRKFDQDFGFEVKYVALILEKGGSSPQIVILENGQELETRYLKYYRTAIQNNIEDKISYDQFWGQIEMKVNHKTKIYFSPDGVYNQININTLKKQGGDYVVNQYDLVIIGNSKDLVSLKSDRAINPTKDAFLLGFPEYGSPDIPMLPGTQLEINEVSKILKNGGYQISQFMEKEASEKNIKAIESPRLVHIATHGYFMKDVENSGGSVFGVNPENASNNPLLRSGLILASVGNTMADTVGADITSNDNGILTAYEAMNLSLDQTMLVVLSACETGLGDVKSGEGVYGLQRAFQVAGAQALIMSLWKVSDNATQMLMTNFYNNWIKMGDRHAAFRQAQIQLMAEFEQPYFWGAFVMIEG